LCGDDEDEGEGELEGAVAGEVLFEVVELSTFIALMRTRIAVV
jgi:hypothetical protein